jgi:hypothetical protein
VNSNAVYNFRVRFPKSREKSTTFFSVSSGIVHYVDPPRVPDFEACSISDCYHGRFSFSSCSLYVSLTLLCCPRASDEAVELFQDDMFANA